MTSKEALERLYLGIYSTNEMANYYVLVLKALDRLEALEEENKELNDIIEKYNDLNIQSFFIRERERDEIKQLKKAIEQEIKLLIERRFNAYACDDYETHNVLNTIIEELKEVLGE